MRILKRKMMAQMNISVIDLAAVLENKVLRGCSEWRVADLAEPSSGI